MLLQGTVDINAKWNEWYSLNKDDINNLILSWNKDEKVNGYSCKQYKLQLYSLAFYYAYLIVKEVQYGIDRENSYYYDKYDIEAIQKCLWCNNIKLRDVIDILKDDGMKIIK